MWILQTMLRERKLKDWVGEAGADVIKKKIVGI